ncbi:MAG: hypothetical protein AAGF66_11300 [Cyanobacteria bacterium P01_H01_bin.119]
MLKSGLFTRLSLHCIAQGGDRIGVTFLSHVTGLESVTGLTLILARRSVAISKALPRFNWVRARIRSAIAAAAKPIIFGISLHTGESTRMDCPLRSGPVGCLSPT